MTPASNPIRLAANISLLFGELPYAERPAAAAKAGFSAIETWWPFGADAAPSPAEVDEFLAQIGSGGLPLIGLNFFAGDMAAGDRGVVSNPERTEEFRQSTQTVTRIARETGCALFNALYGVRDARFDAAEQEATATENLRYAAEIISPTGGTVLIEALADGENGTYPITSPAQVKAVVDATGVGNVRMLADFYHFARNGYDFKTVLAAGIDQIAHIQIADSPGRHEPGTGDIDFAELFSAVVDSGYQGWVAAEYRPGAATAEGLHWITDLGLDLGGKGSA